MQKSKGCVANQITMILFLQGALAVGAYQIIGDNDKSS